MRKQAEDKDVWCVAWNPASTLSRSVEVPREFPDSETHGKEMEVVEDGEEKVTSTGIPGDNSYSSPKAVPVPASPPLSRPRS